jgi:hypothetical protein
MILKVVAKSQAGLFPADRVRGRGKEGRGRREGERGRRGREGGISRRESYGGVRKKMHQGRWSEERKGRGR